MSNVVQLPRWIDVGLLPILNLVLALAVSGLVVLAIGENPIEVVEVLLYGAFGYDEAWGYTLYYTTNFVFTGQSRFNVDYSILGQRGKPILGVLALRFLRFILIFCLFR